MKIAARSWGAGIVNHGSYDDLKRCLTSLEKQSLPPAAIVVYDTGISRERVATLQRDHVRADFEVGANLGYAAGANRVIHRLRAASGGGVLDFVLVLNPDIELEADYAESLISSVSDSPRVAIATGKLIRPDRRTLDSAGIVLPLHRRPRDRGSERPDRGQFDRAEVVDAASGAAMLLRVSALDTLSIEGELFDERFFAYHEDTDLCWRAHRFGLEIFYEPGAVAVHARGWQRAHRREIPLAIRRHSFKNHYLQVAKNETLVSLLGHAPALVTWEILRLGFVILRERELFGAYREAWHELPEALRKRRLISQRVASLVRDQSAQPE
ncbi:MAG: glycosyltransferase family 2 protein [bacterium]|nr:glycosyltransferase family 2 protein [bacterium]